MTHGPHKHVFCVGLIILPIVLTILSIPAIVILHTGHDVPDTSNNRAGYQSGVGRRGTMNLIWSCISTIVISGYATVHPNVPKASHSTAWRMFSRLGWVAVALFWPDTMAGKAALEFNRARSLTRAMRKPPPGGDPLDESGEKLLASTDLVSDSNPSLPTPPSSHKGQWTITHSFFAQMNGFTDRQGVTLNIEHIAKLHKTGKFKDVYPRFDDYLTEINDKSKSDPVIKAFACIQAIWFLSNVIARGASHMSVSPAELVTCGYIPTALAMYVLWWRKPYGVTHHIALPVDCPHLEEKEEPIERDTASALPLAVMCLGSLIFGGAHLLAWNYIFINDHAQLLWRVCSLIISVLPASACFGFFIHSKVFPKLPFYYATISLLVCGIARMSLIILVVMSFWNLPVSVYEEMSWAAYVPTIR